MVDSSSSLAFSSQFQGLSILQGDGDHVRHCKIVGTLGPSSSDEKTLRALIKAGLDIARLNFSHGEHATHSKNVELVRRLAREEGRNVAILQDLQGPKIRAGKILGNGITLKNGEEYTGSDNCTCPFDSNGLMTGGGPSSACSCSAGSWSGSACE